MWVLLLVSSVCFGLAIALGYRSLGHVLDVSSRSYFADLHERMTRLGMDTTPLNSYLRMRLYATAAMFLFVWLVLNMLPVAIVSALLTYRLIGLWLEGRIVTYRTTLTTQLPSAVRNLASQVRAGLPLVEALGAVGRDTPDPLGEQVRRVNQMYDQGRPLSEVLGDLKERLQIDGISLLVISLLVAEERGGNLARVLDRISHTLEEMQRTDRKRDADTAAGQLLIRLLACVPIGFLAMFYVLDPEGTQLIFSLVLGQVVLCLAGLIVYVSVRWMHSILARVE